MRDGRLLEFRRVCVFTTQNFLKYSLTDFHWDDRPNMKLKPEVARLTMQDRNDDAQEGTKFRNVRRRLFQDETEDNELDSESNSGVEDNLTNRFFEEARKNLENAKERWNFDFEKEEPLPGRYEWVKVDQDGKEISGSDNAVENLQEMREIDVGNEDKENSRDGDTIADRT